MSDLLSEEAQAEWEAAETSDAHREPETPASPAENPPIQSIADEFSPLLVAQPASFAGNMRIRKLDDPFDSTPFRLA